MTCLARCLVGFLAFASLVPSAARGDDWPQWLGPERASVWRETGLVDRFPEQGPPVKWRVALSGGYAGPAVAGGKVFVTDYVTSDSRVDNPGARSKLNGIERVLCLSAADGKELWKHEYPCPYAISYACGPRCTPTVDGDRVYTLGAMGDLHCLDVNTGKVLWSKDFKKDYSAKPPMWGFAGHPLVDGKKLICLVGGPGSVAVAFDKETGKELWRSLSAKEPGYSSPAIIEAGGVRQLLFWHGEAINGLNPETGKVYWSIPLVPDYGMAIMTPRKLGPHVFAGGLGGKSLLLKLGADKPTAREVWRGQPKTSLSPVNVTPFLEDGTIYGADETSEFRAVKLETGKRLWETKKPTVGTARGGSGTAFVVKNGDRFVLFSETGDLILARLSPKGYDEISRAHLLEPTGNATGGRKVVWSHPAFAQKCVFARNDKELVCASLAAD